MKLRVALGVVPVGTLQLLNGDLTTFRFDENYLTMPDRPVLGRWFEDQLSPLLVVKRSQSELPAFFQNYLPEPASALRDLLARKAGVSAHREFQLLAALGEDLPGALVVRPESEVGAESAEGHRGHSGADPSPTGSLRFSLAGMQLKFSVLENAGALTLPVTGIGGRFIAKLPSRELHHLPQNEYCTMRWAHQSGILVPATKLIPWSEIGNLPDELAFDESDALIIERYDRPRDGGPRIHQEDFAQVLGKRPVEKYGDEGRVTFDRMGKIIARVCGGDDFDEYVKRLVFIILSGNPDAHLKNWSFIYPDGRRPRLAPAYDLVSASPYHSRFRMELACRLAGETKMSEIRSWHFGKLAAHAGVSHEHVTSLVGHMNAQTRDSFRALADGFPASYRTTIEAHLATIRIV